MPQRSPDIYASLPVRALLADEAEAYLPDLRRCSGNRGLLLSAARQDQPPHPPFVGQWVRVHVSAQALGGDLRARPDEPLPFVDRAFDVVLLRHALELAPATLEEAARVLAPGGTLILTGLNPVSAWAPWWRWQTGSAGPQLRSPWPLVARLRRADLQIDHVQRVGRILPLDSSAAAPPVGARHFGGGYVLVARKSAPNMVPTRLRPAPVPANVQPGLASGARRHSAG